MPPLTDDKALRLELGENRPHRPFGHFRFPSGRLLADEGRPFVTVGVVSENVGNSFAGDRPELPGEDEVHAGVAHSGLLVMVHPASSRSWTRCTAPSSRRPFGRYSDSQRVSHSTTVGSLVTRSHRIPLCVNSPRR